MTKSSSASGAGHILSRRYASAFIDVGFQSNAMEFLVKDIESLEKLLLESQDFQMLISNPVFGRANQLKSVQQIAETAGFHDLTTNFLCVLTQNGRLGTLPHIIVAFQHEIAKRSNVVDAFVQTAQPLTPAQQKTLQNNISQKTGKAVRLSIDVVPELLGGMVVTVGSQMIDDSIASKLARLKKVMTSNSNTLNSTNMKEVG